MFMFHLAYALELIAMSMGVFLLSWALREKGRGVNLAKFFGYVVTIISVILFLCSLWSNFTLWRMHQQMVRSIQLQQNMRPQIMQQLQQRLQQSPNTKPTILHKPQSNSAPQKAPAHKSESAAQKAKEAAAKPAAVSVNDMDTDTGNSSSN